MAWFKQCLFWVTWRNCPKILSALFALFDQCKWGENKPNRGLIRFAEQFPDAESVQIVYGLRQEEFRSGIRITDAANWLMGLSA